MSEASEVIVASGMLHQSLIAVINAVCAASNLSEAAKQDMVVVALSAVVGSCVVSRGEDMEHFLDLCKTDDGHE